MKRSPGHLPADAVGRRVKVVLANGRAAGPWPADGPLGCRWSRSGHPFDMRFYEVVA